MKHKRFLEELAGSFHAGLGFANLFVAFYNFRKGNFIRSLFHVLVAGYEGKCFHEHFTERNKEEK